MVAQILIRFVPLKTRRYAYSYKEKRKITTGKATLI